MMNMVMSVIAQAAHSPRQASEMMQTPRAALAMFPDKELAYELIYSRSCSA